MRAEGAASAALEGAGFSAWGFLLAVNLCDTLFS